MKRLIVLLIISFTIFSCGEKETKPEVINLDFSNYYSAKEINENGNGENKTAVLISSSESESVKTILLDKLNANENYQKLSTQSPSENYKYVLLINETGKVDKVLIEKSMGNELDNFVADNVIGWKFEPAQMNGKKVKYKYELQFDGTEYFVSAEQMPFPVEGINAIAKLVKYPAEAKKEGIQGKVFVKAFVNENGIVDSVNLVKGIGYGCDESAMEAIKQVEFTPAVDNGKKVKAQVVVPIFFKLQ